MDLYKKIHWAIFRLPRYFIGVGPLYYLYSLLRLNPDNSVVLIQPVSHNLLTNRRSAPIYLPIIAPFSPISALFRDLPWSSVILCYLSRRVFIPVMFIKFWIKPWTVVLLYCLAFWRSDVAVSLSSVTIRRLCHLSPNDVTNYWQIMSCVT